MENLLISIIIPVYNTEIYLSKCIESVRHQSYKNLELIFINDGSTDNSAAILAEAAESDSRIKFINQDNFGISSARNRGMKEATGDFIMFLDSDDWIDEKTCEIALKKITQYNVDVVLWPYIREYSEKSLKTPLFTDEEIVWKSNDIQRISRRMVGLNGKELEEPQKIDSLITVWGKLYKKEVLAEIKFIDTKIVGSEDTLFNIQTFLKVGSAVYIPEYLSHYRKYNAVSYTHKYRPDLVIQWRELYRRIFLILSERECDKEYFVALGNRICLGLIGLGLNLIEDDRISRDKKIEELHRILDMQHYQKALATFPLKYLPICWKIFYVFLKFRISPLVYFVLIIMNWLRKRM